MRTLRILAFVFLAAAVLAACGGTGGAEEALVGPVWNLTTLNGDSLVPTTSITAEFSEDGKVNGSAGCNKYSASYAMQLL